MTDIDPKIIEAAALSDADYDGRPWLSMPRPDRDRYLARAGRSINAALAAGLREQIEREAFKKAADVVLARKGKLEHQWFDQNLRRISEEGYDIGVAAAYGALLARLDKPAPSGWREIESAPKDGTRILATDGDVTVVTLWGKANHVPLYSWLLLDVPYDPEDHDFWKPTHWRPLPPPPPHKDAAP